MTGNTIESAILYASIAGATDAPAAGPVQELDAVSQALGWTSEICRKHSGVIIKITAEEILGCFVSCDDAVAASRELHHVLATQITCTGGKLKACAGLHFGSAQMENDDLFGDAINVAARLLELAKPGQTLATHAVIERLPPDAARTTRTWDQTTVRGKHTLYTLYEVLAEEAQNGTEHPPASEEAMISSRQLTLELYGVRYTYAPSQAMVLIGRGRQCDLVVEHEFASRVHALIEYRRGRFILIDQSANGTYVDGSDGRQTFLRREPVPLSGSGTISAGTPAHTKPAHVIRFRCE